MNLSKAVSGVFQGVCKSYEGKPISRACITTLAMELGLLPEVARIIRGFGDTKAYPTRPMITLRETKPSIYLLGWREGDFTDIHDHGDCEVGIYVVQGRVTEDVFACGPSVGNERQCLLAMSRQLEQGQCVTCLTTYIHRMGNIFPEVAATLHVYGPSLEDMALYSESTMGVLSVTEHWHHAHKAQH